MTLPPQSRVAEAELCKDITPKRDCGSRTLTLHYPHGRDAEAELHKGIPQSRVAELRNFGKTLYPLGQSCGIGELHQSGVAEAELCKDMTPRVELRKQNFMMTYPQHVAMTLPPEGAMRKRNFTRSLPLRRGVEA